MITFLLYWRSVILSNFWTLFFVFCDFGYFWLDFVLKSTTQVGVYFIFYTKILMNMKKIFMIAGLVVWLFGYSFGQDTTQEDFERIRKSNFLNQISVQFCDWTQELNNVVEQLASSEVCLTLNNDSDEDLNFWIKFAEQELSNMGSRACRADYQNPIASFIQATWDTDKNIVVPAKSVIEKKFSIRFPLWISGQQRGCVAYGVSEDFSQNEGSMVSIVTRKVLYFDFFVWDYGNLDHTIRVLPMQAVENSNGELEISIPVENIGNIDSSVTIVGTISDFFWFSRTLTFEGQLVDVNTTKVFVANAGFLPWYKWLFTVELDVDYQASFGFDISNLNIDAKFKTPQKMTISETYFSRPWVVIGIAALVLLLLVSMFRKKKVVQQVVVAQTPTPTPPTSA
jgi:hypothetical protein